MVKCPRCGYENLSSSTYCVNCSYTLKHAPVEEKKSRWNMGMAKKIVLIVGIIVIAFLLFSVIYENTQPTNEESLNVITADQNVQEGSSRPYQVKVIYDGDWYSKSGTPGYLEEISDYGNSTFKLDCASWDEVSVTVQKQDESSSNLVVQLIRNGDVVAENSTTNPGGQVTLSYRS